MTHVNKKHNTIKVHALSPQFWINSVYDPGDRSVIRYVETEGGYRLNVRGFSINQSTFLLLAAILVGIRGGYGAVAFRYLISGEEPLAFGHFAAALHVLGRAQVVPVLVVGGIITTLIVHRFAHEARGHGVPEVMASVAIQGGIMRPRIIAVKSLASATCIGFGGSCGREGPIVQIGSTIGSALGQLVHAPAPILRMLVACGAAAGVSATLMRPSEACFSPVRSFWAILRRGRSRRSLLQAS